MTEVHGAQLKALAGAIQIEVRNAAIYESLAQLFQGYDDSVAAIFAELASEERRHQAELEEGYRERSDTLPPLMEFRREAVEAVDLDDPEAFIFDSMTVDQALQAGLRAEEAAQEFYRREMLRTPDPGLQKIYYELAGFEEAHVRLLKDKLAERQRSGNPTLR